MMDSKNIFIESRSESICKIPEIASGFKAADNGFLLLNQAEKEELEIQLAIELNKRITLSEGQILAFLDYVCEMPIEDINKKRALINIFVHSVYLYDDHFTLIVNASNKPLSIEHIPLEEIHTSLESLPPKEQCSTIENVAPPNQHDGFDTKPSCFCFR